MDEKCSTNFRGIVMWHLVPFEMQLGVPSCRSESYNSCYGCIDELSNDYMLVKCSCH